MEININGIISNPRDQECHVNILPGSCLTLSGGTQFFASFVIPPHQALHPDGQFYPYEDAPVLGA